MKIVKPKRLAKGDVIGIISPASSPDDLSTVETGVKYLESLGYRVEVGKNVGKVHGYLAGSTDERLDDLHYMFKNKDIKAIFCVRGGYGSTRILDKIDYNLIKRNPKIFVGYSDISALQLSFFHKVGLVTFAGPMVSVDFSGEVSKYTEEIFWRLLTSNKSYGKLELPEGEKISALQKGAVKTRILGGNLALFTSLIGTDYLPSMKDKILLIEEIGELPYRVDRMLNQLRLSKILSQVKGVVLGAFIDCNEIDPTKRTLTLGEVIQEYFGNLGVPVVYNFKHGHIKDNITVPIGAMFKLNASRNYIEIAESAVS